MKANSESDIVSTDPDVTAISYIPADAWMFWFDLITREITDNSPPDFAWTTYLRLAIRALLEFDESVNKTVPSVPRKVLFFAVNYGALTDELMIQNAEPFQDSPLKTMLVDAMRTGISSEEVLLNDPRAGQLTATVLTVDGAAEAHKLFVKIKRGGGKRVLRGRVEKQIVGAINDLMAASARGYEEDVASLRWAFDLMREQLAKIVEGKLNAAAVNRPHGTYEEKKALCKWINAELRILGLAIKNPGPDSKPCFILANPGGTPGFGRFLLEYKDDLGKRRHPLTSVKLPALRLVADDLARASYAEERQIR